MINLLCLKQKVIQMYSKKTKFYLLPIIIFFQFAFVEQTFSVEHQCHKIYSSGLSLTNISRARSENLIGYLTILMQHQQIDSKHLQIMLQGLENNYLTNPISISESIKSSHLKIARDGIQHVIEMRDLDFSEPGRWNIMILVTETGICGLQPRELRPTPQEKGL